MRALTRKALILFVAAACAAPAAHALSMDPLWTFAPVDTSAWRGDTLSLAMRADTPSSHIVRLVNSSGDSLGPFTLQLAGALSSASGGSVSAASVSFDPAQVSGLASGASADLEVDLVLSPHTPPEIYRGEIQALLSDLSVHSQCVLELRVRNDENLRVAPNPVYGDRHDQVDFRIAAKSGMNVDIDIYTLAMDKVRTIHGDGPWSAGDIETLSWNMTNEAGFTVASGMYIALARFEVGGETFTETHRVMVVF